MTSSSGGNFTNQSIAGIRSCHRGLLYQSREDCHPRRFNLSAQQENLINRIPQASQTQSNPKRGPSNDCEESKTTGNFFSSPLSWLQDQDNLHAEDDDISTIDSGELTPTSTIVSELPDPNGG